MFQVNFYAIGGMTIDADSGNMQVTAAIDTYHTRPSGRRRLLGRDSDEHHTDSGGGHSAGIAAPRRMIAETLRPTGATARLAAWWRRAVGG